MTSGHQVPQPFPDLVEESFEEAAFLWNRWESELASPTRSLAEVWSWAEDRLHGALDGVRAGGTFGVDLASDGIRSRDRWVITVSSGLLASSGNPAATEALVSAVHSADGETLPAIMRGLELLGSDQSIRAVGLSLAGGDPAHVAALCRLATFRRLPSPTLITTAMQSAACGTLADGLRAARCVASREADDWITSALYSGEERVRLAAVESGLSRGMERAWQVARAAAADGSPTAASYLRIVAMLGTGDVHDAIYDALCSPELQIRAIWALGHIGTDRAVDACLAGMKYDALARACGEAYCWITGADLVRDRLAAPEEQPEAPSFEDDDLDATLVPPPEALWPRPDPQAVAGHWSSQRARFEPGVRHIHGAPATMSHVVHMIEHGPMLRRPDLIFEAHARTRGRYDVEPRAFTARQRQMMAASRPASVAS